MSKVNRPKEVYDEELAAKGLRRSYRVEYHQCPDGSLAPIYREQLIEITPPKKAKKSDQWWKKAKKP
jgi:hypothetical protein